jgi:hypothetical protein
VRRAQAVAQAGPAPGRALLVGEHVARHAEQPEPRLGLGWQAVDPPPRDREHVGRRLFRVARRGAAAQEVAGDRRRVLAEAALEALLVVVLRHRTLMAGRTRI